MSQKSGLQRQVLALYRQILRAVREKPESHRQKIQDYARGQIELNAHLDKKVRATERERERERLVGYYS